MKKDNHALLGSVLPLFAAVPLIVAVQWLLPEQPEAVAPTYRGQPAQEQSPDIVVPASPSESDPDSVATPDTTPVDEAVIRRQLDLISKAGIGSQRA